MSFQQFVKELTQSLMRYLQTSTEERQQQKHEWRSQRMSWSHRWFGLLPLAMSMSIRPVVRMLIKFLFLLGKILPSRRKRSR